MPHSTPYIILAEYFPKWYWTVTPAWLHLDIKKQDKRQFDLQNIQDNAKQNLSPAGFCSLSITQEMLARRTQPVAAQVFIYSFPLTCLVSPWLSLIYGLQKPICHLNPKERKIYFTFSTFSCVFSCVFWGDFFKFSFCFMANHVFLGFFSVCIVL